MTSTQKGFTLAESLIVLSIFMILSLFTIFSLQPQHSAVEDQAFITQLKADLLYAQTYAMSHQHEVSVVFMPDNYLYFIHTQNGQPPIVFREYSNDIYLTEGSITLYIKYSSDGNVNRFGTFFIRTSTRTYKVTILIGRGRFYVTQQ
ncbi:competence type IV pilus minor pilin ComGD [Neobacillus dielmonensis]|uniref:competence type IV pilus minor pilin ComGD n=1 Tax=Neobacillus dielmonensis TaxID=1347369 RepID=UPI0005AAB484|nr:competence type IV pilus minor pilin ComGD [Neobacillus dielmonensis]